MPEHDRKRHPVHCCFLRDNSRVSLSNNDAFFVHAMHDSNHRGVINRNKPVPGLGFIKINRLKPCQLLQPGVVQITADKHPTTTGGFSPSGKKGTSTIDLAYILPGIAHQKVINEPSRPGITGGLGESLKFPKIFPGDKTLKGWDKFKLCIEVFKSSFKKASTQALLFNESE